MMHPKDWVWVGWGISIGLIMASMLFFTHDFHTAGYYIPLTQKIVIDGSLDPIWYCHVAWHEYGHDVWRRLNQSQRDEWRRIHTDTQAMTTYASTSPEEDFAETYALSRFCGIEAMRIDDNPSRHEFFLREGLS